MTSCSFKNTEFEKLKSENKKLKNQIKEIKFSKENLECTIVSVPMDNELKFGEDFEAIVMLTFNEKDITSKLTLFDNPPSKKLDDTLKFESVNEIANINFTPNDTGIYDLKGILHQVILGENYEKVFFTKFKVKK